LGFADELGPQAIPLHIAEHRQQVFVFLNRKGLEAPLPNMAAAAVVAMIAADVRR
jgi:hypothetical protein